MAITKDEIAVVLNARLNRSVTASSISEEIQAALVDLSTRAHCPDLYTDEDVNLVQTDDAADFPENLSDYDMLSIDGGEPLEEVSLEVIQGSISTGEPSHFAVRGRKFHLWPTCSGSYTLTIHFWKYHPSGDTIHFGDEYREAVYCGVIAKYLEGLGLVKDSKYDAALLAYYREVEKLGQDNVRPPISPYNDL